jgi:integrase
MVGKRRGRHPIKELNAKKVEALIRDKTAGRHFDGGGLHLFIKGGAASWVLRVVVAGKRKDYGLGPASSVPLAKARELSRQWQETIKAGGDPLEERRKAREIPTFKEVAKAAHADRAGSWRNAKHAAQWLSTLETYAFPEIGSTRIDRLGVADVQKVLSAIWLTKPETARRLRQRLRVVFDVAAAKGYRSGDNPVGAVLAKALPRQTGAPKHHAAMPYADVPAFVARLENEDADGETTRLALRFLILTAARTGEVLGARRTEIDLDASVWTIPAERMKAGREHRVPLSDAASVVIRRALEISMDDELLFPGARHRKPLSNMALLMAMRRLKVEAVPHGFRSAFSDWASEATGFPAEVREMALAHAIKDKTEAAYRRGDLFVKRRKLMDAWGAFVADSGARRVVELRARRRKQ